MSARSGVTAAERDELVRVRRDLHAHPELGYEERRTAGIVAARMRELGYEVREGVATTGVLATRGSGRTLLLRADMDALPVHEESEVDYRSTRDGVMHACGHDGHVAIALAAAARLTAAELPGRIRFAFQPAEEGGGGADRLIGEGALSGVDAALGLHLWNTLPVGKVVVTPGPFMAAADEFTIVVEGRGGHAAKPHEADDPIVKAAALIGELQTLVSRGVDPFEAVVVSVTSIEGGTAFNVIPDRVRLRGTVRTFRDEVRSSIHRRMRELVAGKGDIAIAPVTRALVNDATMCALVREAAVEVVGEENVIEGRRTMAGEDFASFAAEVPACFFHVGSGGGVPHHSPRFDIDEECLPPALDILCRAARAWLARGAA